MSTENKDDKKNSPGDVAAIQSIISSITAARTPIELASLVAIARELIGELAPASTDLKESLSSATTRAKTSMYEAQQENIREEMREPAEASMQALKEVINAAPSIDINVLTLANVSEIASKYAEEKPNLKDGVFGQLIIALEEKEKKEEHRAAAQKRVEGLKLLSEELKNPQSLSQETKDEMIKEAASFKIKLERDEQGNIQIDEKSKKALDKIASLDMQEVEAKRETRKVQDKVDNVEEALSAGSLASFFGADDDLFAEPQKPTVAQPIVSVEHHTKTIPEVVKEMSPVIMHNLITPEIKDAKIAASKTQEFEKKRESNAVKR